MGARTRRPSGLTDLSEAATPDISAAMLGLLADVFALYLKTKNFHWHIAERARKIGGTTLRSVGHIARVQPVADNDADFVEPQDMLVELRDDNLRLTSAMRQVHNTCEGHDDVATTSLLEVWIDETERRSWFLYEAARRPPGSNS